MLAGSPQRGAVRTAPLAPRGDEDRNHISTAERNPLTLVRGDPKKQSECDRSAALWSGVDSARGTQQPRRSSRGEQHNAARSSRVWSGGGSGAVSLPTARAELVKHQHLGQL